MSISANIVHLTKGTHFAFVIDTLSMVQFCNKMLSRDYSFLHDDRLIITIDDDNKCSYKSEEKSKIKHSKSETTNNHELFNVGMHRRSFLYRHRLCS